MSNIELKPCPFCGGEAKSVEQHGFAWIVCTKCPAMTKPKCCVSEAFMYWNRRADSKPIRQSCKTCKYYTPDPSYRDGKMGNCRYLEEIWEKPFYVNQARTECEHFQASERIHENGDET